MDAEQIEKFRNRIDRIDGELVRLLNERAGCALEIGQIKSSSGVEVYQPTREREVIEHVHTVSRGPLSRMGLTRIFKQIIDETRRLEDDRNSSGIDEEKIK
jgi:chorismate mutase-like protein